MSTLARLFIAVTALALVASCASEARGQRATHHVEKRQTFVVIPATAEQAAVVQPVTETTESWEDEETHLEQTAGPDVKQIAPVVGAVVSASAAAATGGASGLGLGPILGGLATLAATTAAGWAARQGTVKQLKDQVDYHKEDAEEGWRKADERALKLAPTA